MRRQGLEPRTRGLRAQTRRYHLLLCVTGLCWCLLVGRDCRHGDVLIHVVGCRAVLKPSITHGSHVRFGSAAVHGWNPCGKFCTGWQGVCSISYMSETVDVAWLRGLPTTFTYAQARQGGLSERHLYQLRDQGLLEQIGRGLYRQANVDAAVDVDLVEIARRAPAATLCLTSALARHGLTDEIPSTIDIALPRGRHRPVTSAPVTWHLFDPATFSLGRAEVRVDEQTTIGLYGPQRCILDAIRLRHREGPELATTALKRWLVRRGSSPADLLAMAAHFPQTQRALRQTLEILL